MSWLGVTMYLTRKAILTTLTHLGGFAPGSEIVTGHLLPPELRDAAGNAYAAAVAPMAAEQGEPWRSFLSPAAMAALLGDAGLEVVEQTGQRTASIRRWNRTEARPAALSAPAHARIPGRAGIGGGGS